MIKYYSSILFAKNEYVKAFETLQQGKIYSYDIGLNIDIW